MSASATRRWRWSTGGIFTQGDLDGVEHMIAVSAKNGSLLWSVLPAPVEEQLAKRVADELKRGDKNGDGRLDEAEALAQLGWNFNRADRAADGRAETIAATRVETLYKQLDANSDGKLTLAEVGQAFRDSFAQIDQPDSDADAEAMAKQRHPRVSSDAGRRQGRHGEPEGGEPIAAGAALQSDR